MATTTTDREFRAAMLRRQDEQMEGYDKHERVATGWRMSSRRCERCGRRLSVTNRTGKCAHCQRGEKVLRTASQRD